MAVEQWSKLPKDIIQVIATILSSDVDNIRLRSVCSHWRSSIRRRYKPSSFPLKVPPPLFLDHAHRGTRFLLRYTTIYRFSPPEFGPCAGNPSDGFLLRVSEVRPNTFSILPLLQPGMPKSDASLTPKRVNLLDFRVSEICKSYLVESANSETNMEIFTRATVIWDFDVDCAFVVVVLDNGRLHYWRFGDKDWVDVDNGDHKMCNFILDDGKCYGIGSRGQLLVGDSKFNLSVVPSLPRLPVCHRDSYFYVTSYESELYVLAIPSGRGGELAIEMKIFKKGDGVWEHIKCLGDKLFLFCNDVIVGLSSKDFYGCKGNCFYVSPDQLSFGDEIVYAEYDLGQGWTSVKNWGEEVHMVISKPPPKWLLSN